MEKIEIWTDDVDIETLDGDLFDYRSKAELIFYWTAPCNCGEHIRHNDGGNYHTVLKFYKFNIDNKEIYTLVKSDTRNFYGDKSYVLYHSKNWEKIIYF